MSRDAESPLVVRGTMRTIEYAVCSDGSMPAREFIERDLTLADRAKLLALLNRMAQQGSIPNREQFKPVSGKVFEFKKHQIRVFCFRSGDRWLLTNGYLKKKARLNPAEIARAQRIMDEHLAREATSKQEKQR